MAHPSDPDHNHPLHKKGHVMATSQCTRTGALRAVAYVRYSTDQQDGSDEQQLGEIRKLADRAGCRIVATFTDQGISGDSGRELRPDFARLLDAVEAGKYDVVLAWDTSRLGRQDSCDGTDLLRACKRTGTVILTCRDGRIDPRESMDRLRWAFSAEGNHMENRRRAYNTTRGLIKNALKGNHNGSRANFGLDRAQFTPSGEMVRRLAPGQRKDCKDHVVRLVSSENSDAVAAVRYAFQRFDSADVTLRGLCRELEARGYPSPAGRRWNHMTLRTILSNPVYRGASRWGRKAVGKYHHSQGDDVVPADGRRGAKPAGECILVEGSDGLVEDELFDRVQRRLQQRARRQAPRARFPLSGLVICGNCGLPMTGRTIKQRNPTGKQYVYVVYTCKRYLEDGPRSGCGNFHVRADRLLNWLVGALQQAFLGPGRDELVQRVRSDLEARTDRSGDDTGRLRKRLAALDGEIGNLVRLARMTPDVAEVAAELERLQSERETVKAELARVAGATCPDDVETEAQRVADRLWQLGEAMKTAKPETLRELIRQAVSRIVCRFEKGTTKTGRTRCKLVKGKVLLRPSPWWSFLSGCGNNGTL
jgi:DNA invertase Pin-like site-specific DNA recombinase